MVSKSSGRGSNFSRADWLLHRLAAAGERMTGPRETVVRALVRAYGNLFLANEPGRDEPQT